MAIPENPATMMRITLEIYPADSRRGGLSRHTAEVTVKADDLKEVFTIMRQLDDLARTYSAE